MATKKNLVIVESPAKAKTIGKYLGPDYVVKASMGHLRDLPKSTLGVDVDGDFTPNYRPIKGKEDIINDLKTAAEKSKAVFLATDPDREGEAISWHLQHLLDLPDDKARRVTFNEITKKVVTDSIQHPRAIDQNLVDAQQARQAKQQDPHLHRRFPVRIQNVKAKQQRDKEPVHAHVDLPGPLPVQPAQPPGSQPHPHDQQRRKYRVDGKEQLLHRPSRPFSFVSEPRQPLGAPVPVSYSLGAGLSKAPPVPGRKTLPRRRSEPKKENFCGGCPV